MGYRKHKIITKSDIFGLNFKLIAMLIIVIFITILYSSYYQKREKIVKEYCGDFGIYGKHLTLYNDNSFSFSYLGCSQKGGNNKGNWEIVNNRLVLYFDSTDTTLKNNYLIKGDTLKSLKNNNLEFVKCENYEPPWAR